MSTAHRAFSGFGIEIEYMIVRDADLGVAPVADVLLAEAEGEITNETEQGPLAWSNELALHVIELKTNGPTADLAGAASDFQSAVVRINGMLAKHGAALLPGAAHPWMNPDTDTKLWPHGDDAVYRAYDRIFGCRGHGWSNLQSMHVNLPFADDEEFVKLHAAVRAVLPLLPALAASSPYLDGVDTGFADARLDTYARNQARIPSITGQIVPEPVSSRADYETKILGPMFQDIAAHDTDGILGYEWLNSRGAIARFDRNAIEIRLLDTQERPAADLAIAALVARVVERMFRDAGRAAAANAIDTPLLAALLRRCIVDAEATVVDEREVLDLFGVAERRLGAGELWRRLAGTEELGPHREPLAVIFTEGTLASRLRRTVGQTDRARLEAVYRRLRKCLALGRAFTTSG
jgi:gamma-glutamyl:cysteine ligase YbdK (ATP-grasp superfamily)